MANDQAIGAGRRPAVVAVDDFTVGAANAKAIVRTRTAPSLAGGGGMSSRLIELD